MDTTQNTNRGRDVSKIDPPSDPHLCELHSRILLAEKRLHENPRDFRYWLVESQAATDDFLQASSSDPFYHRPDNTKPIPGGWL